MYYTYVLLIHYCYTQHVPTYFHFTTYYLYTTALPICYLCTTDVLPMYYLYTIFGLIHYLHTTTPLPNMKLGQFAGSRSIIVDADPAPNPGILPNWNPGRTFVPRFEESRRACFKLAALSPWLVAWPPVPGKAPLLCPRNCAL